jgi:3-phenylpropionate/cinnamic acid dioxygenase small subunit
MDTAMNSAASGISRETFELFLIHEVRLLDERRFREWMELFTDDGTYWVPAVPNQESPFNQASLFYDGRQLMRTRIERLEHPLIHVQTPPSQTLPLVSNVTIESQDEAKGEVLIASSVIMVEYRQDDQRLFAGRQQHRLRRAGDRWRIAHKRVDLANCQAAFEAIAVPI